MGREDWDLSHEYETHDHAGDDDREWFLEVISHVVLLLAAVGLFTLLPWILALIGGIAGLFLALLAGILKLVAGALGLVISAVGLFVSLLLKVALWVVALIAEPVVLLLLVAMILVIARQRR